MKTKDTFIGHPETVKQFNALKAVMKALKIKCEITKEKPYDPDFVAKIEKGRRDYKAGKGQTKTMEKLQRRSMWKAFRTWPLGTL